MDCRAAEYNANAWIHLVEIVDNHRFLVSDSSDHEDDTILYPKRKKIYEPAVARLKFSKINSRNFQFKEKAS